MKITTRQATPAQTGIITALEAVLQSRSEPDYAERLLMSGHSVILGFFDDRPAGYAVLNWSPAYRLFQVLKVPELQDLNVLPGDRRNGLGQILVRACEDLARERGAAQIGLAVGLDKSYGPAQRLYAQMGYLPDGFGVTYDRNPVTRGELRPVDDNLCLMMLKSLS